MMLKRQMRAIIVLTMITLLSLTYVWQIVPDSDFEYMVEHRAGIMDGTELAPFRYRILTAAILTGIMQGTTFWGAYMLAHAVMLPVLFAALYRWLRMWADERGALIGCLILAVYFPLMLRHYCMWAMVEMTLLMLGLLLIRRQSFSGWFAVLIILATLNRATGVLLPMAYIAAHFDRIKKRDLSVIGVGGVYLILWACVFVGLRLGLGSAPTDFSVRQVWVNNLKGWRFNLAVRYVPMLILLPVLALWYRQNAPSVLNRMTALAMGYIVLIAIFGHWYEVRLWLPVFPLCLPLAMNEVIRWH